jgi:hypothetical protein
MRSFTPCGDSSRHVRSRTEDRLSAIATLSLACPLSHRGRPRSSLQLHFFAVDVYEVCSKVELWRIAPLVVFAPRRRAESESG